MSYFPCDIPFMSVDELIENDIHTPEDITCTNVENSRFISVQEALDAVEESRRLNHHKDAKEACAHEYEHRHFLKILMDIQPADVTRVIRCRNCKYFWAYRCMDSMPIEMCELGQTFYDPDRDFCSLAERRKE